MFVVSTIIEEAIWSYAFSIVQTTGSDGKGRLQGSSSNSDSPIVDLVDVLQIGHLLALYAQVGKSSEDCTYQLPCGTLSEVYEKVTDSKSIILIRNNEGKDFVELPVFTKQFVVNKKEATIRNENTFIEESDKHVKVILPIESLEDETLALFVLDQYPTKLTLEVFSFVISNTAPPKAPVFSVTKGYLYLSTCEFKREEVVASNSLLHSKNDDIVDLSFAPIYMTGGTSSINYCTFTGLNLSCTHEKKFGGAAIYAYYSSGYLYITSCTFTNCICKNGYGGAIFADRFNGALQIYGKSAEQPCKFEGCQSICEDGSRGGAIMILSNSFTLYNLLFVRTEDGITSSNVADYGNDYYIVSTDLEDVVKYITGNNGAITDTTRGFDAMGTRNLDTYEDLPLNYFLDELVFENEIYVGASVTFDEYCGRSDYACQSISLARSKITSNIFSIILKQTYLNAEKSSIEINGEISLTLKSEGLNGTLPVLKVERIGEGKDEKSLFDFSKAVENSILNVEKITFEISNTSVFSKAMFPISNGKVNISGCIFRRQLVTVENTNEYLLRSNEDAVFIRDSIIVQTKGSLIYSGNTAKGIKSIKSGSVYNGKGTFRAEFSNSEFSGCSCEDGNGGAFCSVVGEGSSLIVAQNEDDITTFIDCSAGGSGKGGALYIELKENCGIVRIDYVTFRNNDGVKGDDFYAESDSIDADTLKTYFRFLNDKNRYSNFIIKDSKGENSFEGNNGNNCESCNKNYTVIIILVVLLVVAVILAVVGIIIAVICTKKHNKFYTFNDKEELRKNEELNVVSRQDGESVREYYTEPLIREDK